MKQSLQLRLGQQLAMTPQLQQAIRLLQLSTLDLQQEIQEALDSNMMLEIDEETNAAEAGDIPLSERMPEAPAEENYYQELAGSDAPQNDIPTELAVDITWDDVYEAGAASTSSSAGGDNEEFTFQRSAPQTLHDHLNWQLELTPFSERDHAIAAAIIDAVDDDGYLEAGAEDIHEGLVSQLGDDLELDEVQAVLHRVQQFDPPGVAALDLADCLCIQLKQLDADTPHRQLALDLVSRHLDHLARKDFSRIKRLMHLDDDALSDVVALIRSLDPRPGRRVASAEPQYIIPDVYVIKREGAWQVALNPETAPKLRVNPYYSGLIKRADDSAGNQSMRDHLQEARWFIKSLQSRNETLLKVAKAIVERQQDFLEQGETAMRPLVLRDIAEAVSMHESTISRVTTQKYMHTPNGIYEFKFFFSSHVSTDGGGEASATAIKGFIKELVGQESPQKPLSDDKIAKLLVAKGINVARRTVAKYREALGIPPSNERKDI
ncbi:MAG: RNA polymerase factor sigma-54 [Methylococcaceae bacterium]|nr:MAG: RNA polymerase factor sigma-54 [Methylococcaceae bacterium]